MGGPLNLLEIFSFLWYSIYRKHKRFGGQKLENNSGVNK